MYSIVIHGFNHSIQPSWYKTLYHIYICSLVGSTFVMWWAWNVGKLPWNKKIIWLIWVDIIHKQSSRIHSSITMSTILHVCVHSTAKYGNNIGYTLHKFRRCDRCWSLNVKFVMEICWFAGLVFSIVIFAILGNIILDANRWMSLFLFIPDIMFHNQKMNSLKTNL
jgi:hypothetical protein